MAIEAIYIAIAFAAFLMWLGMNKEDSWMVIFSGMIFVFSGLNILLNGFADMAHTYAQVMGVVVIFFGSYVTVRSGVEFIRDNM